MGEVSQTFIDCHAGKFMKSQELSVTRLIFRESLKALKEILTPLVVVDVYENVH